MSTFSYKNVVLIALVCLLVRKNHLAILTRELVPLSFHTRRKVRIRALPKGLTSNFDALYKLMLYSSDFCEQLQRVLTMESIIGFQNQQWQSSLKLVIMHAKITCFFVCLFNIVRQKVRTRFLLFKKIQRVRQRARDQLFIFKNNHLVRQKRKA